VLEDRCHVLVAPAEVAELRPMVVVLALAADPHHAVDGARAAEHAPARNRNRAKAGAGAGLGRIKPIDARPVDEACEADGDARQRMNIAAGFQQQDLIAAAFAEPASERGPRRSRTDDDEIDSMLVHVLLPSPS